MSGVSRGLSWRRRGAGAGAGAGGRAGGWGRALRAQRLPHGLQLAVIADEVGQHEEPDPGPPVIRHHRSQVLQHQPEFCRAILAAGACPAQVVQVQQRIRCAMLLQHVGELLGDRALTRPIDPGEQDALGPACVHQPRLS